jgi:hypothetical protein
LLLFVLGVRAHHRLGEDAIHEVFQFVEEDSECIELSAQTSSANEGRQFRDRAR